MSKIKVNIQIRIKDFQLNGIRLKVYGTGKVERYVTKVNGFYPKIGWQEIKGYSHNGYRATELNKKRYLMHRIIYKAFNPNWDITDHKKIIDHKDRDILNNHIQNLRIATSSENTCNSVTNVNKGCGYAFNNVRKTWHWRYIIRKHGKCHCHTRQIPTLLGYDAFQEVKSAHPFPADFIEAGIKLRQAVHGDFACS